MSYFKDVLKGLGWMGALQGFTIGIGILKVAVLARILSPAQFGVYGVSLLVLGFLEVLTETGINVFLIQEKGDIKKYLNSAWVVSILRGVAISVLIAISAPYVSHYFNTPMTLPLLYLASLVAFIRGLINPMEISFQKNLEFNKVFFFRSSLYLIDAISAIIIGVLTHHESAFIIGMLIAAFTEVILSFIIFPQKPIFSFDSQKIRKIINRGKWITGAGTFNYIFQNLDNVVVGKLLGASSLGLYQQAYRISTLPVSQVGEVFNKVTFPLFVQINNDKSRLKKAFIKIFFSIICLVVPFTIFVFLFTRPLILLILGEKWLPVEGAMKILAIFGIFKSIVNSSYGLLLSLRKQEIVMLSELFGIIGMGVSIIPLALKFGLVGVAYSTIIGASLSLPVILLNYRKIFNA